MRNGTVSEAGCQPLFEALLLGHKRSLSFGFAAMRRRSAKALTSANDRYSSRLAPLGVRRSDDACELTDSHSFEALVQIVGDGGSVALEQRTRRVSEDCAAAEGSAGSRRLEAPTVRGSFRSVVYSTFRGYPARSFRRQRSMGPS